MLDRTRKHLSVSDMFNTPLTPEPIRTAFATFDPAKRARLERLRALIFEVAEETPGVGPVSETLKWGQPSYATPKGTPLRLGLTSSGDPALFAHCQSRVILDAHSQFWTDLNFEGNRAIVLSVDVPLPEDALRQVIHSALTYRLCR